ncbi:hypothetical protein MVEN_01766300 [Mycena venus]|uniref:Uncharacterized protein n=1 Tax=Mycena venus TaxID=2733690 RepID=A0A8H6XN67_9AGAR|nr:hypothetical protein MVEN_01766300 [Mycena venus]
MSSNSTSSDSQLQSFISSTAGPLIVATAVQSALFGAIGVQTWTYFSRFGNKDRTFYRYLALGLFLLNTIQFVVDVEIIYCAGTWVSTGLSSFFSGPLTWTLCAEPAITAVIVFFAHLLFMERCGAFAKKIIQDARVPGAAGSHFSQFWHGLFDHAFQSKVVRQYLGSSCPDSDCFVVILAGDNGHLHFAHVVLYIQEIRNASVGGVKTLRTLWYHHYLESHSGLLDSDVFSPSPWDYILSSVPVLHWTDLYYGGPIGASLA